MVGEGSLYKLTHPNTSMISSSTMSLKFVVVLALLAVAAAQQQRVAPHKSGEPIAIVRLENEGVNFDGSYKFNYETAHGIRADETGSVKQLGGKTEEDSAANQVQGSYSYVGDDGQTYTINYVSDEFGFRAEGAHLPTPPPVPAAILRSLEYIRSQPQQKRN